MTIIQWLADLLRPPAITGAPPATLPPRRSDAVESALFARALAHVLSMEGGYSDDPYDPGGPTNLGITLAEYARWKNQNLDALNVFALKAELRTLPHDTAARIYRANYWDAALCAALPAALAVFHFDCAVNQGVAGAARMLQQGLGVDIDGAIGPITLSAAATTPVATALARYADARRAHYRSLSTFWRFGRGWLSRVDATLTLARSIAADPTFATPTQETRPMTDTPTATQAPIQAPTAAPTPAAAPKWWGQSMTIWGIIITGLSTVLPVLGPLVGLNITADLVHQLGDSVVQAVQAAGGLVGMLLSIWGRVRAIQPIARQQFTVTL